MLARPTFRSIYKEKERDVLNLFTVEGEGGYLSTEYTFMYKSSAFFNPDMANKVKSIVKDDTIIKEFTIPNTTTKVEYMDNILRIVTGNNNKCVMYRDGTVDISNSNYDYPYLKTIMYNIKDTFCPSSYASTSDGSAYKQMLLLNNGDLIYINTKTRKDEIVSLTGVQKFLTKNQARKSDAIVGCINGDMYHVWVGPTPLDTDGTGTESGFIKIDGIKHTDLIFCALGDDPENCVFCKRNEPQKLYRFVKNGNGSGTNFKIIGLGTSPVITLNSGEYFVDGMAHEESLLLITNKRIITKNNRWTGNGNWERDIYENPSILAKKIVTPTAYSMIIEDIYGKYWICNNSGSEYTLEKPVSYTFFDQLKEYLIPIRNDNK